MPPLCLPDVLHQLKRLLPQLTRLQTALRSPGAPVGLTRKGPVLTQLLELLPMLPDFDQYDFYPPPPNPLPALLVKGTGKAYLSQELVIALQLRAGQPANLLPPSSVRSSCWHLDLRPDARGTIDWYPGKRPKIKKLQLREGILRPDQELTLRLLPGAPEFANIYPLLPDYAEPTTE